MRLVAGGDLVPAERRVLQATDLFLGQSALTGESLPVEKFAHPGTADTSALEMPNLVFMGTNVISGPATAAVLSTRRGTYIGPLAARATHVASACGPSAFQLCPYRLIWP